MGHDEETWNRQAERRTEDLQISSSGCGRRTVRLDGEGDINDMDLRADVDLDDHINEEEDEDDTPAEKRSRLAKLHLENVKTELGEVFNCVFLDALLLTLRISLTLLRMTRSSSPRG